MILLYSLPESALIESIPILHQYGLAGVLLLVIGYIVWKGTKYFTAKEVEHAQELVKKDAEIERLRLINKELTEQMISQISTFATTLLSHEKDNLMSINDVTNSLNQLIIVIKELQIK